nr:Multidrug efflux pump subunit AcrA [uncultured bacterium]
MRRTRLPGWRKSSAALLVTAALLASCSDKPAQGPQGMKVPVSVVKIEPQPAVVSAELPGRVEAIKDAQIRARVSGIVNQIKFQQGGEVKEGQSLFTIDPAPYKAVRDQAAARLMQARADARAANLLSQRYSRLVKEKAVSQQEYDNARAAAEQANANVAAAKAALKSAEIDLGYTEVVSPISGRIGKSYVTEGALVSATQATQLALVQQLDQVYVDLTRSTAEVAQLRKALASGVLEQTADGAAKVEVVLEDGSLYGKAGKLLFSGITVDPTTGQVSLRAVVPNPDQILLPGMYVRVRLQQGVDPKALLVPQQAVQRNADGGSNLVLIKDGKAVTTPVTLGPLVGGKWMVTKGLSAGDTVVVEGFQKIRPGAPVQPMPWKEGDAQSASSDQGKAAQGKSDSVGSSGAKAGQSASDAAKPSKN